jgi:anti-sigma factor RsiW
MAEDCQHVFELLSEYLDRELPPDACEAIEAHIAGCKPCVAFVQSLRKTIHLCRGYKLNGQPSPLCEEAKEDLAAAYRTMLARNGKQHPST